MDVKKLAEEIIAGKRLTRQDDLSFFLTCDLKELQEGADLIRKHFCGDKVDLCVPSSMVRAVAAAKTANIALNPLIIKPVLKNIPSCVRIRL